MAERTLLWSFDSSIQDANENVVLDNRIPLRREVHDRTVPEGP